MDAPGIRANDAGADGTEALADVTILARLESLEKNAVVAGV